MTKRRLVSVVMPAYNEELFIGTLIDRIRRVDLTPVDCELELIVIDDGSKDRTAEIVEAFDGVRLVRKPNGGKGSAVRAGIAVACLGPALGALVANQWRGVLQSPAQPEVPTAGPG